MKIVDEAEDFLLRGHDEICQRYSEIEEAADEHPYVIEYLETLEEEEEMFFRRLRMIADMPDATVRDLYGLCDYIYWAAQSGIDLTIYDKGFTRRDYRKCQVLNARYVYFKNDGSPDTTQINSLELMRTFSELTQLTSGELEMENADTFLKYSGRDKDSDVPKFILYSGHAANVGSMLTAFGQDPLIVSPNPASAIYLQFSECKDEAVCG